MERVLVAIGGNVGAVEENLSRAVRRMADLPGTKVLAVSPLYLTAPVGGPPRQPVFRNGAVMLESALKPDELLCGLLAIEGELGRVRTIKDGPRTVDLDLLLWGDRIIDEEHLTVPHPRLHQRAFVLAPLADIAPDMTHPQFHRTVAQLLAALGPVEGIERSPHPFPTPAEERSSCRS
jgi:2-amino-4-hydroxy-6-hydroxymethyldihydropteridine diphosphokinase